MRDAVASDSAYSTKLMPTTRNRASMRTTISRMTPDRGGPDEARDRVMTRSSAKCCARRPDEVRPGTGVGLHVLNDRHLPRLVGLPVPDPQLDLERPHADPQ